MASVAYVGVLLCVSAGLAMGQAAAHDGLADNTVLIVRHAEKPEKGTMLTPTGERRAALYATYFEPFREDGMNVAVDALYAGADSANSSRPRLTLEPIAARTGLHLNTDIGTKDTDALIKLLRTTNHPSHPLVSWRHSQIPDLLRSFTASPDKLLPGGKWPDDVYDWVIVLQFDKVGKLASQKLLHEHLVVPQS